MRLFHCSHCGCVVFFDSTQCVNCGHTLAFVPEIMDMAAFAPANGDASGAWTLSPPPADPSLPARWYMCGNRTNHHACNFAVADDGGDDNEPLCASCLQTRLAPDLGKPENLRRWTALEAAKRRLYYTLARLGLESIEGEEGPAFQFLEDLPDAPPVLTGHADGLITVNVAEADDDERARRRLALGEPYRTLLGHLRHESGHYFWDVLVLRGGQQEAFRAMFGDERLDYAQALQDHYAQGPRADWQESFVSAYAASHPWEDWAETWAHYLHMVDLLETAASYQAQVAIATAEGARPVAAIDPFGAPPPDFDALLLCWTPFTLLLNSLTRSLGQQDAYPFALPAQALTKLRFVHDLVRSRTHPQKS